MGNGDARPVGALGDPSAILPQIVTFAAEFVHSEKYSNNY